uniref:V-B12-ORF1 n=1 Tax=Glypta fumiferanae TaxID=389681 RepID=A0A0F6T1E4_9HYME|nr:V-B12-ORF1 [Glypta fumiferanae]
MSRDPNEREWAEMILLAKKIGECKEYLSDYKFRAVLKPKTRQRLVIVQMNKAELIAKLKMLARNFTKVPSGVMNVYF